MATSRFVLSVPAQILPDGTGTGNNPAPFEKVVSSGTQTTNTPKVTYFQHLFDQSTDETIAWAFRLPGDYVSGGTVYLTWGAKVTTNNVIWKAGIEAGDPSSTDMDAAIYNAADLSSATAVPGTVGHYKETSIALTMTGATAGDFVVLFVGRDADNASDTAAGDATLLAVSLEYTS